MAESQRPLQDFIRIVYPVYILYIYLRIRKIRKDYEQERNMSRLVRVKNSVRHAQAQGLARRISLARQSRVPATELPSKSRVLETIFFYLGVILEAFWGHFGGLASPIWGHFGVILGTLGGSVAPPGSRALLDPLRGGSRAPLGRSWGPSWGPRRHPSWA